MAVKNIDTFIAGLKAADSDELGFIIAITTHCRNFLRKEYGWDLENPEGVLAKFPKAPDILERFIEKLEAKQSGEMELFAAGMMVWLHTLHACDDSQLRPQGYKIWMELQRGRAFAKYKAERLEALMGHSIDISGFNRIPQSLKPETIH